MFEWDSAKSERNRIERGFGFGYAARIFSAPHLDYEARQNLAGEARRIAIGRVDGHILTIVYVWRGGNRRIISARGANRRERHAYRQALGKAGLE